MMNVDILKIICFTFIKNSGSFSNNDKAKKLKESILKVEYGAMQISNVF